MSVTTAAATPIITVDTLLLPGGGGDGGGGGGDGGGGDGGGGDGDFALHLLGFVNPLASGVHAYKLLKASAPPKI